MATPVGIEKTAALAATISRSVPSLKTSPLAVNVPPVIWPPRVYAVTAQVTVTLDTLLAGIAPDPLLTEHMELAGCDAIET
jgi:hypothetical protein